jgi:hypothetical protein
MGIDPACILYSQAAAGTVPPGINGRPGTVMNEALVDPIHLELFMGLNPQQPNES